MDWSSFWPDMIVGVATGVVVGLVLVMFERRLAGNRKRLKDERWLGRMERFEEILRDPVVFEPSSYAPSGAFVERMVRASEGIDQIHRKVFARLPELDFLHQINTDLDALQMSAERLEHATRSLSGFVLFEFDEGDLDRVREAVRTAPLEVPWSTLVAQGRQVCVYDSMKSDPAFIECVEQYRLIVARLEAYRAGFVTYRSSLRWEGHRRSMERLRAGTLRAASARNAAKHERELRESMEGVFGEEITKAQRLLGGC